MVSNHNWKIWNWPWWTCELDVVYDKPIYSHFAGFGPFQWHWYSFHEGWTAWLEM